MYPGFQLLTEIENELLQDFKATFFRENRHLPSQSALTILVLETLVVL